MMSADDQNMERSERIRAVIADCTERRNAGEPLSDEQLIQAHGDLMPELQGELKKLRLVQVAHAQAKAQAPSEGDDFLGDANQGSRSKRLDDICDQFEAAWKSGKRPRIEDYLTAWSGDSTALLTELLALELELRDKSNDPPSMEEYLKRFPAHPDLVHSVIAESDTIARPGDRDDTGLLADDETDPIGDPGVIRRCGDYEILAEIGEGGMGTVYQARHTRLDRIVALKMLPTDRTHDVHAIARFDREMRAAGRLSHPHIVMAHDAGDHQGQHFLAMEYVEGLNLAELVGLHGPLPVVEACEIIRQASLGLQYAHENGLVHRDIKPSNLMLTPAGQIKILDLGLALLPDIGDATRELTYTGQAMGTLDYMAPEQGDDSHEVDVRADIYSLGATLYKLLSGVAIFSGPNYQTYRQKWKALATEKAPAIQSRGPAVPDRLAAIVHRMIEVEKEDRYPTAAEVAQALADFAAPADLSTLLATVKPVTKEDRRVGSTGSTTSMRQEAFEYDTSPYVQPGSTSKPVVDSPVLQVAPRRSRRPTVPMALGLLAVAVFAAIFVFRTPDGTVEIEIPEGVDAKNISVAALQGGKVIEVADEGNGWKISLEDGKYQLELRGGQDSIKLDKKSVTVTRRGLERVSITITPIDAAPEKLTTFARRIQQVVGLPVDDPKVAKLRDELIDWRRQHLGTSTSVEATQLLAKLPCPLDRYTGKDLPKVDPPVDDSVPMVAVFGGDDVRLKHWGTIMCVAWSDDGTLIVTSSLDGTSKVWDAETGQLMRAFDMGYGGIAASALSPNGNHVALSTWRFSEAPIVIWDAETGDELRKIYAPDGKSEFKGVYALAYSPDGEQLAFATDAVYVASLADDGKTRKIGSHDKGPVTCLDWSPDGQRIVSSANRGDGMIRTWDVTAQQLLQTIKDGSKNVAFMQNSSQIRSNVGVYDTATGKLVEPRQSVARQFAVSQSGRHGAGRTTGLPLAIMDLTTGKETILRATYGDPWENEMAFSPDGKMLATAVRIASALRLWSVPDGKERWSSRGHTFRDSKAALNSAGRLLAIPENDCIRLIDLRSGEQSLLKHSLSTPTIHRVEFSPDGRVLLARRDGEFHLFDPQDGRQIGEFGAKSASFLPRTAHTLLLSSKSQSERKLAVFDYKNDKRTELSFNGWAHGISPDGRTFTTDRRHGLAMRKLADGQFVFESRELAGESVNIVNNAAFSPDGQFLAKMYDWNKLVIVEASTGESVKEIHHWHRGGGKQPCTFSPDGRLLAFAVSKGEVNLVDTTTWKMTHRYRIGPTGGIIEDLFFSPEGRHLLTANGNGTVYVLRLAEPPVRDGRVVDLENPTTAAAGEIADRDVDRFVAKWVLEHGGGLQLIIPRTREYIAPRSTSELPGEDFRITNINFESSSRTITSVPREIGRLTAIQEFHLGKNGLQEIPVFVDSAKSLLRLHVSHNPLSAKSLSRLANLSQLQMLSLAGCGLKDGDLVHLPPLKSLSFLRIYGNPLTGDGLEPLKRQTALRRLGLDGLSVTSSEIDDLQKALPQCVIVHPAALVDKPELDIALSCQQIRGPVTIELVEEEQEFVSRSEYDFLPTKAFRCVAIDLSGVNDFRHVLRRITKTSSLRSLNLARTSTNDDDVDNLSQLKALKSLDLRETKVTAQGIAELRKALPECKILEGPLEGPQSSADHALDFDGKTSYVQLPEVINDESHPLTVEAYLTPRKINPVNGFVISNDQPGGGSALFLSAEGQWKFAVAVGKTFPAVETQGIEMGRAAHVAGVFDGKMLRLFVEGKIEGTLRTSGQAVRTGGAPFVLAGKPGGDGIVRGAFFDGLMDEVRISKIARYDKNFTPDKRFESDQHTLALYHFDEGQGEVLRDSSGNNRHGKIVGAKWVLADLSRVPKKRE